MPTSDSQEPAAPGGAIRMAWPDLLERPRPSPTHVHRYGEASLQIVDLWLPEGPGPHPVVLMVHGGCWQTAVADRRIMNWVAEDLRRRGLAVWNIEYRGVDMDGGGYPGTFLDVGAAADALRDAAAQHPLRPGPYVAIGHSAGGHLALWLAARSRLPAQSPLRAADPLAIESVISLGGLPDLEEAARPPGSGCGTEVVARLVGTERPDPWADTSLPRLAPIGVRQSLVNGTEDRVVPAFYAEAYATQMRAAGDEVEVRMIGETGHVELIAPESAAWAAAVATIEARLGR